ncbi:unnamed protein product [Rhizoctonia solani]|uniref:mRNA-capping enzyme subunit beta n=1 Tax=Rhizoctonia solani TaxID=456999 RepID=A0A8H3H7X7_9AGAM|nr:unnamed protein product [Rhizoctonia solani]
MATGIHMPSFKEPERSPQQDTSDLFGDDDDEADTNSESDDFEEVHVPSGAAPEKAPPEVIEVDDDNEAQEDEEDDFLPSRVNKYAPINEPSGSSPRVPPAKRRRPDSPPTKLPARPNGPNVHPPSNYKPPPVNHALPTLAQHGPHMPTYFNTSSNRNEPLAPSIINSEPLDEVAQEICSWIEYYTQNLNPEHVEIEAKLGIIIDKGSNSRLGGLSLTECVLPPELPIDTRFESNMPQQAHKHYNGLLNKLVAQAVPGQARVKYSHTKLVDEFYGEGGDKIRLTRDEKTGKVAACVRKKRIANLDVHSPKQNVDWRISINVEEPASNPTGNPAHTRRKDRISYTHQAFKIDLTQVTSSHNGPNQQLLHELEVEFVNAAELLRHRARRTQLGPGANPFDDLVRVFVNNVRIMARNSTP